MYLKSMTIFSMPRYWPGLSMPMYTALKHSPFIRESLIHANALLNEDKNDSITAFMEIT